MTIKMAAMTWTRTDISDKFSVIFSHGIRSINFGQDIKIENFTKHSGNYFAIVETIFAYKNAKNLRKFPKKSNKS